MLTNVAPITIVASIQNFSPKSSRSERRAPGRSLKKCPSPSATVAYAFTIVTLEQIRRNVLIAVTGMLSTIPGLAHSPGAPNRRMM